MAKKSKNLNFDSKINLFKSIIKSQSGVLYIKGRPGIGKTALFQEIAKGEKWNFIDCRLSQMDETDFRFPYLKERNGEKVSSYAYPSWVHEANEKPTLIMFDEINRASLAVRNAALQMLNERQVGDLKLNKNVFMVAVGNLGEEDGTEVEEFDTALNNRLIHYKYDMTFPEWRKGYADKNVNPTIISFIENSLDYYYRAPAEGDNLGAYPTPRSWTFLSDLIHSVYGKNASPSDFIPLVKECGHSYIGSAVQKFLRYCEDTLALNVSDVVDRFHVIKEDVKKLNRDRKSELLNDLKKYNFKKFFSQKSAKAEKRLENIADFLNIIDEDERVSFLNDVLDSEPNKLRVSDLKKNPKITKWLRRFSDVLKKVSLFGGVSN